MEYNAEDYSHYNFSEETVHAMEILQLEPVGVKELYGDNWFRSPRTDYEQFKADLVDALHPDILDPGGAVWEPYEFDGGGERLDINLVLSYYEILIFDDLEGIRVNVRPYD